MENKDKSSFFRRWSKRKISHDQNSDVNISNKDDENLKDCSSYSPNELLKKENDNVDTNEFTGLSDQEILKKLNLPNPEKMKIGDNFKVFLKKNVPEHLKKKALRKLWLTNPIFANLDGMNEYDEDFTLATSALEEFATNYVVGKGFKGQYKPEIDPSDLDVSEQEDTLRSSSVRLDQKNEENTDIEKSEIKEGKNFNEKHFDSSSDHLENPNIENDNEKAKEQLSTNLSYDRLDTNDVGKVDFSEENTPSRIKPKKMIFKV